MNGKLNPTLSNACWANKAVTLAEHTVLHLNKQLLNAYSESDRGRPIKWWALGLSLGVGCRL